MEGVRDVQVRLFLGVLFGIFTGMLIAEALPHVIWWFAIPIGAVLGGTMFAAPEIRRAAPGAARLAWQSITYAPGYWNQYNHAPLEIRRGWQIKAIFTLTVLAYMGAWAATVMFRRVLITDIHPVGAHLITLVGAIVYIAYSALALPDRDGIIDGLIGTKYSRRRLLIATPLGLPIVLALLLFYAAAETTKIAGRALRDVPKFLVRFSVELFWQMNSRPLVITVIGSGVGVGMFFPLFRIIWQWEILPATVTGAPIGAVASLVYYRLVPKRVLKAQN